MGSVSEDEDPGDFVGLPGATDESTGHGRAMDVNGPGWPPKGKAPGGVPPPHYKNYDHLTRKETRNLRNANMFPRSSIAEVKRLVAETTQPSPVDWTRSVRRPRLRIWLHPRRRRRGEEPGAQGMHPLQRETRLNASGTVRS